MKHKVKKIHFIGVGGVGMSGIAEVLYNLGYKVSGSDLNNSYNLERLANLGIITHVGHDADNVGEADVVVVSSAIDETNPEIVKAREKHIPIVPRAMMLAELMRFKIGIAIAGTHGKTTTTSLASEVFRASGMDPTFVIGGKLAVTGSNAKLGSGEYLIAEADESDASFLYLTPTIAVVTNIDLDHMETYDHDESKLKKTFVDFLHRLPFYGRAILCYEDERIREIIPQVKRPITTYGFSNEADVYATDIKFDQGKLSFNVNITKSGVVHHIEVNAYGRHNVLNSLAVIITGIEAGIPLDMISQGLSNFHGVGRRSQSHGSFHYQGKEFILIDDYGHHPTEVKATLTGLQEAYPDKRMVVLFQPHRYSRTKDLFDEFVKVLQIPQQLVLVEVYPAGEKPINGATSKNIISQIRLESKAQPIYAENIIESVDKLLNIVEDNDLVVTMGAGDITKVATLLKDRLVK